MIHRSILNRLLIIGFMILVGYCLAKAFYSQSAIGVMLALVSLGAGVYFLYLLNRIRERN